MPPAHVVHPDLILDVGMYDGNDTAYYLHKGFRVIAVEADPMVAAAGAERFSEAIRAGKLQILNIGVGNQPALLTFFRNLANPGLSSFDRQLGTTGGQFEELPVEVVPLASILEEHGIPFYLKIDIEGFDEIALATLRPELAPAYISAELNFAESILEKLRALGYRQFKLITQKFHTSSTEITQKEIGWRIVRRVSRAVPVVRSFMQSLPHALRPKVEWDHAPWRPDGWTGATSSGPFAEETHGPWRDYRQAQKLLQASRSVFAEYVWWDIHARK